ncbi:helix-turn-helix domain-containing protein [Nocardia abscessus]|uniref:PucR family transcriptional regulator n=1 Tax=Nocardia abscessus TaxID=120957 RepID=UPI00189333D8|nr:helix-turn-helix domain-containing protein [Nocardia abscessus]MBF6335846.1 helix-turn-helix domain-containing protein [Nocardia abscessus]
MTQQTLSSDVHAPPADVPASSLRALVATSVRLFADCGESDILRIAAESVAAIGGCDALGCYRVVDGEYLPTPPSRPAPSGVAARLRAQNGEGRLRLPGRRWGWALPLRDRFQPVGAIVVGADHEPPQAQMFLLTALAQLAGAALTNVALRERACADATDLTALNEHLSATVVRLERRARVHEVLSGAAAYGTGEQGIADALAQLTGLPVAIEDRFGNPRAWGGPGRPDPYPRTPPQQREELLHRLAAHNAPLRVRDRVVVLVKPRTEILGTLALIDPDDQALDDQVAALAYGGTVLAPELAHQRNLAELELRLRRDLVEDLLSGTDTDSAFARAEAMGYDLHGEHYVVLVHGDDSALADAVGRAATALDLPFIQGRRAGMVVLITDRRPEPVVLHHAVCEHLDAAPVTIGISGCCTRPADFAGAFDDARRAIDIRLRSRMPDGATAFDELGFYRLVDAARADGRVEQFMREWLGILLDYDRDHRADLVHTLSRYLECGGNYDDSAAALHIHRSTLRYRLGRIRELTGFDLRDVDTRFNLQAATRAWRFLSLSALPT